MFRPIIESSPTPLVGSIVDHIHRGSISPKPIRYDHPWTTVPLHHALQRGLAQQSEKARW